MAKSGIQRIPMSTLRNPFLLFMLFITAGSLKSKAQTDQELEDMATATCACITAKNPDYANLTDVQAKLGVCMLESAGKMGFKFDGWTEEEFRQLGEKVGFRMASKCPKIFEVFAKKSLEEDKAAQMEVKGRVKEVELRDIATLVVREETGKEHRLLWVNYFAGSDDFTANPASLVSRMVTITYEVADVYLVKSKGYVTSKVITKLTLD